MREEYRSARRMLLDDARYIRNILHTRHDMGFGAQNLSHVRRRMVELRRQYYQSMA